MLTSWSSVLVLELEETLPLDADSDQLLWSLASLDSDFNLVSGQEDGCDHGYVSSTQVVGSSVMQARWLWDVSVLFCTVNRCNIMLQQTMTYITTQ